MKEFAVVVTETAERDLFAIYDFVSDRGGREVAFRLVSAIETYCRGLSTVPERGTKRDDLRPGLRTLGFKRRATILFEVNHADRQVIIHGVYYAGRSVERDFGLE